MPEESLSAILEAASRTEETRSFIKQVRRITRRKFTPEEKIRIVLEGFRDMKMRPSLERALKHREILEA